MARKAFNTTLEEDLIKKLKKLAIDRNCNINDLLEESIQIILDKYLRDQGE